MNKIFDFSHLDVTPPDPFSDLNEDVPVQSNAAPQMAEQPEMVETFLGPMRPPQKMDSPEQQEIIKELINMGAGSPGMKLLGAGIGKGTSLLKNMIGSAMKKTAPYEEAAIKAGQEYEAASKAANPVKPGIYHNPTSELENIESEIGKHINIEGEHGLRASKAINHRIKSIEDYWSDAYKKFEDKIKDAEFHMPEKALTNLNYDMDAIVSKLKEGVDPRNVMKVLEKEAKDAENPYYKELISKAPTAKDSNASDFLAKYKDFRNAFGGLKQDLKSERYGSMEKEKIAKAIQKGKEMETQIKDVLDQGLGEFKPEYDWLMKGYSQQVFPLRKNPIVKAAKKGKLSKNILHDLRTDESGMNVLRDVIKQDPELLRNIIGQKYLSKASDIHVPNEHTRSFLNEMPELNKLISRKEKLLQETAKRKDISLAKKLEAEKKLKDIKTAKSKATRKLLIGSGVATGAIGVPYGVHKIGSTLIKD